MANNTRIKVTLVKSLAGQLKSIQSSVRGLGLRHRHHTVTIADTRENRGMINSASHLVKVEQA